MAKGNRGKVQDPNQTLIHAGGRPELIEDFLAIRESRTVDGQQRYSDYPTLDHLADIIIGRNRGSQNKDAVLFELCHLVAALSLVKPGPALRTDFFFSGERRSSAFFKSFWLPKSDHIAGITVTGQNIEITLPAGHFNISFARMPLLCALYEFLAGMKSFGYFESLSNIMAAFDLSGPTIALIRSTANQLSSDLRLYRKDNLAYARYDGKFLTILNFLKEKNESGRLSITDQDIFDFWHLHCKGKDYKGYKTVFDHFVQFSLAYEEATTFASASNASRLGSDWESGELDIADDGTAREGVSDWVSPLGAFEQEALGDIRFFKASSERKPMEKLMELGRDALDLPIAYLRYEIFGQVQSAITTDLQVGRGVDSVQKRLQCEDIETYADRLASLENILAHAGQLQASLLHVLNPAPEKTELGQGNVVRFADVMSQAEKSFAKMSRKGFSDDLQSNAQIKPALRNAADALTVIADILQSLLRIMNGKGLIDSALADQFKQDQIAFRTEFQAIYGQIIYEKSPS